VIDENSGELEVKVIHILVLCGCSGMEINFATLTAIDGPEEFILMGSSIRFNGSSIVLVSHKI